MMPINFEGAQVIKRPDNMTDEQCSDMYAMHGVDTNGFAYYLEAWKPNKEDLEAINRGEPIYIKVLSNRLPPIAVFTIDEQGSVN